jgi:SNF family Na+-dependent transporter
VFSRWDIGKGGPVKKSLLFAAQALLRGVLIVVPFYLAVLLLLKGMQSVASLLHPLTLLMPDWLPAERLLSLVLVLLICLLIGIAASTRTGRVMKDQIESRFFARIPGYGIM